MRQELLQDPVEVSFKQLNSSHLVEGDVASFFFNEDSDGILPAFNWASRSQYQIEFLDLKGSEKFTMRLRHVMAKSNRGSRGFCTFPRGLPPFKVLNRQYQVHRATTFLPKWNDLFQDEISCVITILGKGVVTFKQSL